MIDYDYGKEEEDRLWKEKEWTRELLYEFEKYMYNTTDVRDKLGGYVHAEKVSEDGKYTYIDLHWGVNNSLDKDDNVEHCYILTDEIMRDISPKIKMKSIRYVP